MKLINLYLLIALSFSTACSMQPESINDVINVSAASPSSLLNIIPDVQVPKEKLELKSLEGKWYFGDQAFSGKAVIYHANGIMAESISYYKGKKESVAKKWFADGLVQKISFYKANRLEGQVKVWSPSPNRQLIVESNYQNGKRHGVQRRWYPNGQLFKQTNIHLGKEKGLQQAWRKNGKIYVNYEAKNGRIFGLKQTSLCYELDDEIIQYGKK